jgi:hypothetical protein
MNAADVLRQCARAGVLVSADGGRLHVRSVDGAPVPSDLLVDLRAHKAELLAILAGRPEPRPGRCWSCGQPVLGWPAALFANCAACALTGTRRVLARLHGIERTPGSESELAEGYEKRKTRRMLGTLGKEDVVMKYGSNLVRRP